MQTTSTLWQNLEYANGTVAETVLFIAGKQYSPYTPPQTRRSMYDGTPTLGNCVSATLTVEIRTTDVFPRSAQVDVKTRLVGADGTTTDWLSRGTFFISTRRIDFVTGIVSLECYDSMLKAAQKANVEGAFPKTQVLAVSEIAEAIGVEIDERTELDDTYTINRPVDLTMQEVLGFIGTCNGGNWVITPENKLRLVPFADMSTAVPVNIRAVLTRAELSQRAEVTGVRLIHTSGEVYFNGTDDGLVLTSNNANPYVDAAMCQSLYDRYVGLVYTEFTTYRSVVSVALELGDVVAYKDSIRGIAGEIWETLYASPRSDVSAKLDFDLESEYPYTSPIGSIKESIAGIKDEMSKYVTSTEVESAIVQSRDSIMSTVSQVETKIDTKSKSFFQADEPSLEDSIPGDVWIQTGTNKLHIFNNGAWIPAQDTDIARTDSAVAGIEDELNRADTGILAQISSMWSQINQTAGEVQILVGSDASVANTNLEAYKDYIKTYLSVSGEEGNEGVKIGTSTSKTYIRITGEQLQIRDGDDVVARFSGTITEMHDVTADTVVVGGTTRIDGSGVAAEKLTLTDSLDLGNWHVSASGGFSIKWIGG